MKRTDFLLAVIGVLVVLNAVTLFFLWRHRPPAPPLRSVPGTSLIRPNPADFIIHELNLDEKQQEAFETLRADYGERMREYRKNIDICRRQLPGILSRGDTAQARAVAEKIGLLQKQIEWATFEHFRQVRALCTDKQKKKFDDIIQQVLRLMTLPPRPPRPQILPPLGPAK